MAFAVRAAPQSSSELLCVFRHLGNFSLDPERVCLAMHSSERSVEYIFDRGCLKEKDYFLLPNFVYSVFSREG